MNSKAIFAMLCLLAGIPLAAYGFAGGGALFALPGLALLLGFWFLAWQWISKSGRPQTPIQPSANAAWSMRDQPVEVSRPRGENDQ
jgi:hypothetical protein